MNRLISNTYQSFHKNKMLNELEIFARNRTKMIKLLKRLCLFNDSLSDTFKELIEDHVRTKELNLYFVSFELI